MEEDKREPLPKRMRIGSSYELEEESKKQVVGKKKRRAMMLVDRLLRSTLFQLHKFQQLLNPIKYFKLSWHKKWEFRRKFQYLKKEFMFSLK